MWIATDKEGHTFLFSEKPTRNHRTPKLMESMFPGEDGNWYPDGMFCWRLSDTNIQGFKPSWEDEPIEVNILPKITPELKHDIALEIMHDFGRRDNKTDNLIELITNKVLNKINGKLNGK